MKILFYIFILLLSLSLNAQSFKIDGIEFFYKEPTVYNENSQIMVLFGGRNWQGDKTLKTYNFYNFANKHKLFLISPSFKDKDYWQPKAWSGKCLKKAIVKLEEKFKLKSQKLFFYGYSAGGQCSNLFYEYMPNTVEAFALHACGVYPEKVKYSKAPALITCGINDSDRFRISKTFIYKYRENGGSLIFKHYNSAHELNREALDITKEFFDAIIKKKSPKYIGEDDTMQVLPISKIKEIDTEFRNPLYSEKLKELWKAE